jgi:tungstate transport system substrate-binding protein
VVASTTEVHDAGLLASLVPAFEGTSDCKVTVESRPATEALALGREGRADVLLVDAPAAEKAFMAQGHGSFRVEVMHDSFLLVGPSDDPAQAAPEDDTDVVSALKAVAGDGSPFIARADGSGVAITLKRLWREAGVTPKGEWYRLTAGSSATALMKAQKAGAYAFVDRATYVALQARLGMRVIAQGGAELDDPYSVIVVKHPDARTACARAFAEFLDKASTQAIIRSFGVGRYGDPLYLPDAPTP